MNFFLEEKEKLNYILQNKTMLKQEIKKWFSDMISNPDGTYSSKRVAGWIVTFHFMGMCYANKPDYIVAMSLGAMLTFWGLSTIDYKSYMGVAQNIKSTI